MCMFWRIFINETYFVSDRMSYFYVVKKTFNECLHCIVYNTCTTYSSNKMTKHIVPHFPRFCFYSFSRGDSQPAPRVVTSAYRSAEEASTRTEPKTIGRLAANGVRSFQPPVTMRPGEKWSNQRQPSRGH